MTGPIVPVSGMRILVDPAVGNTGNSFGSSWVSSSAYDVSAALKQEGLKPTVGRRSAGGLDVNPTVPNWACSG